MTLRVVFVLGLILTVSGCRAFSNKTVDMTNDPNWWVDLRYNRFVKLKEDSLINGDALSGGYVNKSLGKYQDEIVRIEDYKANPSRWPELSILKQDTRLRCVELE